MSDLGNKKIFGSNLSKLIKQHDLTVTKLADDLGFKVSTVWDWTKGNSYPRIDRIEMLANYFNVKKSYLVERHDGDETAAISTVSIPVIGEIACGDPITAEENIEGYRTEVATNLPTGTLFYLKAKGHSMEPTIKDGTFVLIHEQPEVEDGQIAAVLVDDDSEATLKRVKHQGHLVMLMPDNAKYDPIVLTKDYPGRIIGRAIRISMDL